MKVLVTGGLGFIGSHITDMYLAQGHEVVVVDNLSTGKLSNYNPKARYVCMSLSDERLEELIDEERPDLVNHQAAHVSVRGSVANPMHDIESNILGTVHLLSAAGKAGVKRFIFASSGGTVYGYTPEMPVNELYVGLPISPYGINKLACEHYIRFFSTLYGFEWVILRYSNVYGRRQNPHGECGVISIFLERFKQGLPPVVFGDGSQVRDYVHVSDVVNAVQLFSGPSPIANGVYNVGTGIGTTLSELLKEITSHYVNHPKASFTESKSGDLPYNVLDITKIAALGWQPKKSLTDGIEELCKWEGAEI